MDKVLVSYCLVLCCSIENHCDEFYLPFWSSYTCKMLLNKYDKTVGFNPHLLYLLVILQALEAIKALQKRTGRFAASDLFQPYSYKLRTNFM